MLLRSAMRRFLVFRLDLILFFLLFWIAVFYFCSPYRTRDHASTARSCMSNEKQIGLALLQYVEDYDEKFPCGLSFPDEFHNPQALDSTPGMGWAGQVFPYIKNTTVFHCPDDPTTDLSGAITKYACSYVLNANVAQVNLSDLNAPATTVLGCEGIGDQIELFTGVEGLRTGVPNPSDRFSASTDGLNFLYFEPDGVWGGSVFLDIGVPGGYTTHPSPSTTLATQRIWLIRDGNGGRHTDGSNFIACDGHVKWQKPDAVSVGHNASSATAGPVYPGYAAGTSCDSFRLTFSTK